MTFFSPPVRRDPFPMYHRLRGHSPVLHFAPTDMYLLLDHESVKRAIVDHETFGSDVAPGSSMSRWLIFMDPPRHGTLRALVSRAFTGRAIAGLEPRIRALSLGLLERVQARGEFDLVAEYAVPLPLMVIAELLGAPLDDWERLRRWSDVILDLSLTLTGGEAALAAQRAYVAVNEEMRDYLELLLEMRRGQPTDDLLGRLLEAEVEGERLSLAEILGFFQLLLIAGHETTTNLISNAMLEFIEHPEQLQRLEARPELLGPAIEEVLRHRSPVQAVFRVARRTVELHGQTIEAGKLVLPMLGAANRDPKVFAAPDVFDIARDPNPHVAFGHGTHFCLGAALSRLEAKVALPDLLGRLKRLRLAEEGPWEPREPLHVHGPARLPVCFEPA